MCSHLVASVVGRHKVVARRKLVGLRDARGTVPWVVEHDTRGLGRLEVHRLQKKVNTFSENDIM